jgi:hypothetical protein
MIMTMDDLDRLEALHNAATPAPWYVRYLDDRHFMNTVGVSTRPDTGGHEVSGNEQRAGGGDDCRHPAARATLRTASG